VRVHLCGVRGSTPAPGVEFAGVGGHTSSVAVAADDEPAPRLELDAGTGIRRVTALCGGAPFAGTIVLTHLHWDHVQGLPFFAAGDRPDARVALLLPEQGGDPAAVLGRGMSPPHFPIPPEGLQGDWRFAGLDAGRHRIEGFTVVATDLPHPGGRTFGLRIEDGGSSLAYVPDHGPSALGPGPEGWGEYHDAVLGLVDGVDVLLHDASHTAADFAGKAHYGHCPAEYAVELGRRAGAGEVVLVHHDPGRQDDAAEALGNAVGARVGREGDVVDLVAGRPPCWHR
jgi:phosphoribosyl 1,2-cyclic phosphodiesterase